jgi:2-phospho-L-lactate transferase/gluconeogenesis factor (CofD/UPF0052 family)
VYVCNVATQLGETEGYTLSEHLAALHAHGVGTLIDAVIANDNFRADHPADYPAAPVAIDLEPGAVRPRLLIADVVDDGHAHRHDPAKLTGALMRLQDERQATRAPVVARSA